MNEKNIKEFWDFITQNQEIIREGDDESKERLKAQGQELLNKIGELVLYIEDHHEKENEFGIYISAAGVIELFDLVKEVVKHAPQWEMIYAEAFLPGVNSNFYHEFGDLIIDTEHIYYQSFDVDGAFNLLILIPNIDGFDEEDIAEVGCYVVEMMVGEYLTGKIEGIEFMDLEDLPNDALVFPITELKAELLELAD